MPPVRNTADLRELLLSVIEEVRNGSIEVEPARAVSALAGQILNSARLDIQVAKLSITGCVVPTPTILATGNGEHKRLANSNSQTPQSLTAKSDAVSESEARGVADEEKLIPILRRGSMTIGDLAKMSGMNKEQVTKVVDSDQARPAGARLFKKLDGQRIVLK